MQWSESGITIFVGVHCVAKLGEGTMSRGACIRLIGLKQFSKKVKEVMLP